MALTIDIPKTADLPMIEGKLRNLEREIRTAAHPQTGRLGAFEARLLSDWSDHLFKEQWAGMAIAEGLSRADEALVKEKGLTQWPPLNDEAALLNIPSLLSLQRNARVTLANGSAPYDADEVRRYLIDQGGLLGRKSGRWRSLIELDPQAGVAPVLNSEMASRDALIALVRKILDQLEVGAYGRRAPGNDLGPKATVLEFLSELHTNGWEHAREDGNVRAIRLMKHLYLERDQLAAKAGGFGELQNYVLSQSSGNINLVEVCISDFGPGILDGFLNSFAGRNYGGTDRAQLLDRLLHEKLSAKSGDPNAGLGIRYALEAARAMWGFVSLRTGEFWFTLDGSARDRETRLARREGRFPKVQGTHWQLLYPDMISGGRARDATGASV